nr:reverse transcriptase domain-containing protein [Tanacetum cinerariifolium]
MRTRSSSNLVGESSPNPTTSNLKRRNYRHSKQPFILEESPVDTMADQSTMAELLCAPTEGYAEAIVILPILAVHFKLKLSLIKFITSDQFFIIEKDNPHDHIRWFNKITSTIKYKDVPNSEIKLMLFPFSLVGAWNRYKDLLYACPHRGFTELHQLDTFYNALNPADQDSLNSAAGGNLLERRTQDVLTIIENKCKVLNSRNKSIVSQVKSSDANSSSSTEIAKLTHTVNQQTSAVTTAMTVILKQFQATLPLASVNSVEEICVTCGGANPYYQCLAADGNTFPEFQDNIQGYVSAAAVNYNQGNSGYRPPSEDKRVEDTLMDPDLAEYTIKVPPPLVQKAKPHSQRNYVVHQRDPRHPHIPYPSRMNQEKQQEKDEIQIHKFLQMFKQLHINITLADALILILKYQKMLKSLLSNKEKLLELANTPLNENFLAVILKKLLEKLRDPGKFLILCGFGELKCKALADLGANINLMPLSVWKKLGLPELISTCMTLKLANRAICTPVGILRDVFVSVGTFTFPIDFVIVDYESDPRVPLILGRPFLQTARALIEIHREEIILRDVINPLSGNTTSCSPDYLREEFADELALITFQPRNDGLPFDIESDFREIEYLLNHGPTKEMDSILEDSVDECNLADPNNDLSDTIPEMFTDKHTLDYSSLPLYDDVDVDLVELVSETDDVYVDPFDSKKEKINESKLLIDEIDPPRSSDFLPSPNENLDEVTVQVTPDKNVKKTSISNASLILEEFDP